MNICNNIPIVLGSGLIMFKKLLTISYHPLSADSSIFWNCSNLIDIGWGVVGGTVETSALFDVLLGLTDKINSGNAKTKTIVRIFILKNICQQKGQPMKRKKNTLKRNRKFRYYLFKTHEKTKIETINKSVFSLPIYSGFLKQMYNIYNLT